MSFIDQVKATSTWGFLLFGLVLWVVGAALVASEKVVPTLGPVLAAVGAILIVIGPIVFWLALIVFVIELLIALFRSA